MEKQSNILIIRENIKNLKSLTNFLSNLNLNYKEVNSFPESADKLINKDEFNIILIPLDSLNESNLNILRSIKFSNPNTGIILLYENENKELVLALLEKGIVDHIIKSDNTLEIYSAIKNEFHKQSLIKKSESYLIKLKKLKTQHDKNIKRALDLEEIYDTTIENLMTALDLRDVETFGHSRTVAKYSQILAQLSGIEDKTILDNIRKGALLHDIGKIAIPDSILKKPSNLSFNEWKKIKLHPTLGFGLIKDINSAKEIGNIILYHHERFDGHGYPRQLNKNNIPKEARIFAVADALDAITSHRPYRKEKDFQSAKREILLNSGTQFDPEIVKFFCSLDLNQWQKIKFETTKFFSAFKDIFALT